MIKAVSIASCNWKVLIKSLVCQMLVLAVIIAFGYTVFGEVISDFARVLSSDDIKQFVGNTVTAIVSGEFNSAQFTEELNAVLSNLQNNIQSIRYPWGGATLSYIMFFVMLCVYRLFVSYTDVTVMCQIQEFMTSNASRPFVWYLMKKQGRTWQFSLLQMLCAFPMDILIATSCIGLYLLVLVAFGWWTIIPVIILALLLYSARQTLFAFCLPAVACEETSTNKAFKSGLSQIMMRFWRMFWKTLIVITLMLAIALLAVVFIDNSLLSTAVMTVPSFILFFYLKCVNAVGYLDANERAYFHKKIYIEGTDAYVKRQRRLEKRQRRQASRINKA